MGRKTKEETLLIKRDKWVDELIQKNKFLREPKYYKNNYWSHAAWDSWAAQGKAGGCSCCGVRYYNANLCNTRRTTREGGKEEWCKHAVGNLCSDCTRKIEEKLGVKFNSKY